MIALPIAVPIFFAAAFMFAEVVLILGSWVARAFGFIRGDQPGMSRKFLKISLGFALVACILAFWIMATTELIN